MTTIITKKKRVGPQAGFTIPMKVVKSLSPLDELAKALKGPSATAAPLPENTPFSTQHLNTFKETFTLQKGGTTDDDGIFTKLGVEVMTRYSNGWRAGVRDLELERQYPELTGSFYDVRADPDYARRWADDQPDPAPAVKLTIKG